MNINDISMDIYEDDYEIPFRSYTSSSPINNISYLYLSKLKKDNSVHCELYSFYNSLHDSTTLIVSSVVSIDNFFQSVNELENDIKKIDSTVSLLHNTFTKSNKYYKIHGPKSYNETNRIKNYLEG